MAEEQIEVTIDKFGKVTLEVNGVAGMDCLERTEELIALLGGEVEDRQMTAEAYVDVEQGQQDQVWH